MLLAEFLPDGPTMSQTVMFIVATVIWGGAHYYIGRRLIVDPGILAPWSTVAWALVALHASLSPLGLTVRRLTASDTVLANLLQWATYLGMGFFVLLFLGLLAKDAVFFVLWLVEKAGAPSPLPTDPSRRMLLSGGLNLGIFAATGVATGIGFVTARRRPTVEEVDLKVPGLHPSLDGFRIVQISDMHIGPTLKRDFVETVVDVVNGLKADLVAMTGDLADNTPDNLAHDLDPMNQLKSRFGTYYVTGNHECYWDAPAWQRAAASFGMTTLANSHVALKVGGATLLVGGVNDLHTGRFLPDDACDPHAAMEGAPPHDFSVLLAHQPGVCYEAVDAGWNLQLSGHTHGGQFWPINYIVGMVHPFSVGLGRWKEKLWVYVNRGTGYWGPPLRLGVPSEITLLVLRAA